MESFKLGNEKGVPFFNRRYTTGVPFLSIMVYKRVWGWTSGLRGQPPGIKRCRLSLPSPPPPPTWDRRFDCTWPITYVLLYFFTFPT